MCTLAFLELVNEGNAQAQVFAICPHLLTVTENAIKQSKPMSLLHITFFVFAITIDHCF